LDVNRKVSSGFAASDARRERRPRRLIIPPLMPRRLRLHRAGPGLITKDAARLDWPTSAGGEYRVLRQGTNGWTCCQESQAIHTTNPDASILPSCNGSEIAWRTASPISTGSGSRTCARVPNKSAENHAPTGSEFHVGPHIMIVSRKSCAH